MKMQKAGVGQVPGQHGPGIEHLAARWRPAMRGKARKNNAAAAAAAGNNVQQGRRGLQGAWCGCQKCGTPQLLLKAPQQGFD